jgi:hypothetical protein
MTCHDWTQSAAVASVFVRPRVKAGASAKCSSAQQHWWTSLNFKGGSRQPTYIHAMSQAHPLNRLPVRGLQQQEAAAAAAAARMLHCPSAGGMLFADTHHCPICCYYGPEMLQATPKQTSCKITRGITALTKTLIRAELLVYRRRSIYCPDACMSTV